MAQEEAPRKRGRPRKIKPSEPALPHPCVRCGKQYKKFIGNFYKNSRSDIYNENDSRIPICANCLQELQAKLEKKFRDKRLVYMTLCAYCDVYYTDKAFYTVTDSPDGDFGKYCRIINGVQYKDKTFQDTIMELNDVILKLSTPTDLPIARKMNDQDKQNMTYVISSLGYDCFDDDTWSEDEKRFAYNTLADYLSDDVLEDSHKVQCVITMVKTFVQVEQIDKSLNAEMRKVHLDSDNISKLSNVKKSLLSTINTMAKENGISAITSGKKTQGGNTLTGIMKQMEEHKFEEIKVNVLPSKLSASFKEVATDNIKAIMEELSLTNDDFAEMLSKQTELVAKQQDTIDKVQEEKRQLKLEIKRLEDEIYKLDNRRKKSG